MRASLVFFVALCPAVAVCSPEPGEHVQVLNQAEWVSISVAPGGQPIVLPVALAGQSSWFFLMTESPGHCFDMTLRPVLGESIGTKRVTGLGQTAIRADVFKTPLLRVGSFEIRPEGSEASPLLDFSDIRRVLEQDIRGLLGASFLRDRLVQFDFDDGVVRLSKRNGNNDALGTQCPLRLDNSGHPWVDNLQVGDRTESFQICTGSNSSIQVHNWLFNSLQAEGKLRKVPPRMEYSTSGPEEVSAGLLSNVSWGGFAQRDVWIENGERNALGLKYLSRFVITMDATGGCIYLRPGKKLNRPDSRGTTGFEAEKREGVIVVTAVRERSPASEAGVFVGDLVTSINGVTCRDMRLLEFAWRIEESKGARLALTLDRKGTSITLSFDVPLSMGPELFSNENGQSPDDI